MEIQNRRTRVCQAQSSGSEGLNSVMFSSVLFFVTVRTAKNSYCCSNSIFICFTSPFAYLKPISHLLFFPQIFSALFSESSSDLFLFKGQILSKEPLMIRAGVGGVCAVMRPMSSWGLRSYASGFLRSLQGHHHGGGHYGDCHYGSDGVHGSGGGRAVAAPCWPPESFEAPS